MSQIARMFAVIHSYMSVDVTLVRQLVTALLSALLPDAHDHHLPSLCSCRAYIGLDRLHAFVWYRRGGRVLARDQSASLEYWQKLARTGEIVWLYNGRDRKKTGKIVTNGHFGRAVSQSWLNPWG